MKKEKEDPFNRKKVEVKERVPQTALKIWNLPACVKAGKGEQLVPLICKEKEFRVTKGLARDLTVEQAFSRMCFSPNDKYIIIRIEAPGLVSKMLTVLSSKTLEPVWTWDNDKGPFYHIINLTTCSLPGHPNSWLILFDGGHQVGVTTIVIKEKGVDVQGYLGWSSHASKIANPLRAITTSDTVQIIGLMEKVLHMWQISPSALKKTPPTKLLKCKRVTELPKITDLGELQVIGTALNDFHISGLVCYSLSEKGEVKVTDIGLFQSYKQADKIDCPVSVCRLSLDCSNLIVAGGSSIACFDAKTGKLKSIVTTTLRDKKWPHLIGHVAVYNNENLFLKTEQGVQGKTGSIPLSIFNQPSSTYNITDDNKNGTFSLEPCTAAKISGEYRLSQSDKRERLWSSDLSVSPDRKWLCKPPTQERAELAVRGTATSASGARDGATRAPVRGLPAMGKHKVKQHPLVDQSTTLDDPSEYKYKLLMTLVNTETGKEKDIIIHRHQQGTLMRISPSFFNQYKGAFSDSGKYFAAWGNFFYQYTGGTKQKDFIKKHWPPMIKLYEFTSDGELQELSKIEDRDMIRTYFGAKPTELTSLYFLPGDRFMVSTTRDGKVQLRGPLPELSVTAEHVTKQGSIADSQLVQGSANQYLVTCSADRCVRVWRINLENVEISNIARYHNSADVSSVCGFIEDVERTLYVHFGDISGAINVLKVKI